MAKNPGIRTMGAPPKRLSKRKPLRRQPRTELTPKQRLFLERYMLTLNAARAYLESHPGCSWATANTHGSELLKDRRIGSVVEARLAAAMAPYRPESDRVLGELASLAFSNIRDLFDRDGALVPLRDLPARTTAAVRKVKSKELVATDPETGEERVIGHLREIEMKDSLGPLRMLGAHLGMSTDKREHDVKVSFAELLRARREKLIPG